MKPHVKLAAWARRLVDTSSGTAQQLTRFGKHLDKAGPRPRPLRPSPGAPTRERLPNFGVKINIFFWKYRFFFFYF